MNESKQKRRLAMARASWFFALAVLIAPAVAQAAAPDLTATNLTNIVTTYNYNLGPTGMRGWLYRDGANVGDFGTMTGQKPWQILVVTVGTNTPASGIMASNDVILGVSAGAGNVPVPLFTNDARKSLGWAIGAAEAGDGVLNLKRWRTGVTNDVSMPLAIIGAYSATAPFDCPKSALILSNAVNLITNKSFSGAPAGPVLGLALLASGNTNFLPMVQAYARSIAPANLALTGCDTWGWGYRNVFLAEYYLLTGDTNVLPGINEYTVGLAKGQSLYGTFGHGGAEQHADGSLHGSISWYGPVNSAGLVANLAIVMGRKCIVASGGAVHPEIDPAIERSAKFFGYYVGKGSIPYGEHEPWAGGHGSNGKDQMAALLFAMQDDRPLETEYFTRMSVAGYNGREYGHTGQGFSYLWGALAANIGGTNAVASHLAQVRWHLDLSRRSDGSFVYDGGEQYGGSALYDYWGSATYAGIDPTASYVLTYALAKQKLLITGRNANPSNWLSSAVVSNAIWVGNFNLVCGGFDTNQLMAAMSEYDPGVRWWAATTLGTNTNTSVSALINLASHTNSRVREAACQALGVMKNTNALAVLGLRLTDTNIWVRSKAARALKNFGTPALPQLTNMLTAFITNATDPHVIVWEDPIQIANGYLADALFNTLGSSTIGVNTNLLYPAVRAGLTQPDGMALNYLSSFLQNRLTLTHVQAVAPSIIDAIAERSPADRMFSDSIRFAGLKTLGKYKIEEGIPLALMVKEQTWHGDDWTPFDQLQNNYRGAARDALPTLYAWQAHIPQFAADGSIGGCCPDRLINISNKIAAAIAAIVNDPAPPTLVNFKKLSAVNTSPSVVTLPATSTLLSTAASDLDGGVLNYSWSKVRGAGNVTFTPNGTANSNVVAAFDTPGSYVLRLAAVDRSILNSNIWITYNLGYFDFQTYTNLIGAVYTNVTITVSAPTNRAPVPQNQSLATALNTAVSITLAAGDSNGDAVTFIATTPAHGTLSGAAPNLVYTPTAGFTGFDSFTFTANDGQADSGPATVTVDVGAAGNRRPVAANQSVATAEDTPKLITLAGTDADGNPLTYTIVSPPINGTLAGALPNVTYLPATNFPAGNFSGTDSFTFTVNDASLTSAVATVNIAVTPVNNPPVALAQSVNVSANTAKAITLAGFDAEGYAMLFTNASNPAHGALSGTAPNLIYRPATNFHSADSFTFRVTDSEGAVSSVATVSITVSNEPPVAHALFLEVPPNSTNTITLTGRDNTGDPLMFTVLTQPASGLLSGTAPNLTYRPTTDFTGADSFTFKVSDGVWDATNTASITVVQWQNRTNIAAGFWSIPASWAGGVTPAFGGGADYLLVFSTNVYSGSSTNDLAGTFQLNRLIFGSNLPAVTIFSNAFAFTNHAVTPPLIVQASANARTFSNAVTLAADTTVGGSGAGAITLAGVVSGSGGLLKTNSGTLTLSAVNTYSGGTVVSAGTLNPHGNGSGASRTFFGTGVVTLANGTILKATDVSGQPVRIPSTFNLSGGTVSVPIPFGGGTDLRLDGPISGPGGISVSGGTRGLSLHGTNTFSGGVTISDGNRVVINNVNALGVGPLRLGNASGGSLNTSANLSGGQVSNAIHLAIGAVLTVDTGSGSLNLAGNITNTGGLTKNGNNTLTLSGTNSYTGVTSVRVGVLACARPDALGGGALSISNGATLNLNFTGPRQVASLNLGGTNMPYGSYGSASSPASTKDNHFTGTGTVTVGPLPGLINSAATGITSTAAALRATLEGNGTIFHIVAYWNTMNAGTNAALWTNSAYLGAWTSVAATNLSFTATGLTPSKAYYFTFRATNATSSLWADNVQSFTTLPPPMPPTPVLPGSAITFSGGIPGFTFATVAGFKYRVVFKTTLSDVSWMPVIAPPNFQSPDGWSATSTGATLSCSDAGAAGQPQRFYRIEAANP